jgi:hypothetical protein
LTLIGHPGYANASKPAIRPQSAVSRITYDLPVRSPIPGHFQQTQVERRLESGPGFPSAGANRDRDQAGTGKLEYHGKRAYACSQLPPPPSLSTGRICYLTKGRVPGQHFHIGSLLLGCTMGMRLCLHHGRADGNGTRRVLESKYGPQCPSPVNVRVFLGARL